MDIRNYVGQDEQKKKIPVVYLVIGGAGIFILLILMFVFVNVKKRVSEKGTDEGKEKTVSEDSDSGSGKDGDELLEDMWIDNVLLYEYDFAIENKNDDDSYLGSFLSSHTKDRYIRIAGYNMGHSIVGIYQSSDGEDQDSVNIEDMHTSDAIYMVREGNFVRSDGVLTKLNDDISPNELTSTLTTVFKKACALEQVKKKVISSGKNGDSGHYVLNFPEGGIKVETGNETLDKFILLLSDGTELSIKSKGSKGYRTITITGENADYYFMLAIDESTPNFVLEEDFSEYETE